MPKRTNHLPTPVSLGLVPGLNSSEIDLKVYQNSPSVEDNYEREFKIKEAFIREKFKRFFPGPLASGPSDSVTDGSFFEAFRSPSKNFRFRTSISVLRSWDREKIVESWAGFDWLEDVCCNGIAHLDPNFNGIPPGAPPELCANLGHFLLVDKQAVRRSIIQHIRAFGLCRDEAPGLTPGPRFLFLATQPDRIALDTLSKSINALVRNEDFLRILEGSAPEFLDSLACIKVHSTFAFEGKGQELLGEEAVGVKGHKVDQSYCGLVCNFVIDTESLVNKVTSQNVGVSDDSDNATQPPPSLTASTLLPFLRPFSTRFPNIRFVASAHRVQASIFRSVEVLNEPLKLKLYEELDINDSKARYLQVLNSFSNPNPYVAIATAKWLRSQVYRDNHNQNQNFSTSNLIELYCGVGSHTMALKTAFKSITAVDINPHLIEMLRENVRLNGEMRLADSDTDGSRLSSSSNCTQVTAICAPSANFCRKLLKNLQGTISNWILVDPPREGLDPLTLKAIMSSDATTSKVLYVSCNPNALERDLDILTDETKLSTGVTRFRVAGMCMLDHFPFSAHIETAVMLERTQY